VGKKPRRKKQIAKKPKAAPKPKVEPEMPPGRGYQPGVNNPPSR
jgi:hypothetical protein